MLKKGQLLFLSMSVMITLMLVGVLSVLAQTPSANSAAPAASELGLEQVGLNQQINPQAQASTPQITNITILQSGDNPLIEITGSGFGKNPNNVKVMFNDNGVLVSPQQAKNKKLIVQAPSTSLCTGQVRIRVIVGATSSNTSAFSYQKSAPIIYSFSQEHLQAGASLEIKADNLACDSANNLVTVNDNPVPVLAVNMDRLTIRIPETFSAGKVKIRLTVGSQSSLPKDFTIDEKPNSNNVPTTGSDNILRYLSTSPAGASFAPMFSIRDKVKNINSPSGESSLWEMNFYGSHLAIIDLPWKVEGVNQKGLILINIREANNVFGDFSGNKQRFVYALVRFPKNPEKPYHPDTNPFHWGACSIATEALPGGGVIFNSVARASAGIDSFEINKTATTTSKATMTFKVIAPDLGVYEDYGINYSKAGNGQVRLPKVATITVEMKQVDPNVPVAQFRLGSVVFTDGINGSMATDATFSNLFSITDVPDIPEFGLSSFR